jgi:predicted aspartyl protease
MRKQSFTIQYPAISNTLRTNCGISEAYNPNSGGIHPTVLQVNALWDTGATNTVITKNIADKLNLKPQGQTKTYHADGESMTNIYYVNVLLPNNMGFAALRVTEGKLNGVDVLIGMDIIKQGDFAISHTDGKTKFTFQMPSTHDFDFFKENNKEYQMPVRIKQKTDSNEPCPCGSGKKYKHCCGKGK